MQTLSPVLQRLTLALGLSTFSSAPAQAQQSLIIGNDRGGLVSKKAQDFERPKRIGQRAEVRDNVCYSSCTMYLGASNVCVSPQITFGFHGPCRCWFAPAS